VTGKFKCPHHRTDTNKGSMADVAQQPSPQHSKKRNVKKVAESGEHLLETPWTIWYSKKISAEPQTAQYQSHLKKLGTFSSLESFYRYVALPPTKRH